MSHARAVILVAPRSVDTQHADATTILTAFTIRRYMKARSTENARVGELYIVAEILEEENVRARPHRRCRRGDRIQRLGFSLLAHAIAVPGTAAIISRVANSGANNVYLAYPPPDLELPAPFEDVLTTSRNVARCSWGCARSEDQTRSDEPARLADGRPGRTPDLSRRMAGARQGLSREVRAYGLPSQIGSTMAAAIEAPPNRTWRNAAPSGISSRSSPSIGLLAEVVTELDRLGPAGDGVLEHVEVVVEKRHLDRHRGSAAASRGLVRRADQEMTGRLAERRKRVAQLGPVSALHFVGLGDLLILGELRLDLLDGASPRSFRSASRPGAPPW